MRTLPRLPAVCCCMKKDHKATLDRDKSMGSICEHGGAAVCAPLGAFGQMRRERKVRYVYGNRMHQLGLNMLDIQSLNQITKTTPHPKRG